MAEAVLNRDVDGAFACGLIDQSGLESCVFFREEIVMMTAPGRATIDIALARGGLRTLVLRAGCSYRQHLEAISPWK